MKFASASNIIALGVAAVVSQVGATRVDSGGLGAILRELSTRALGEEPSCIDYYDSTDFAMKCYCGPGRIRVDEYNCITPPAEGQFTIFPLDDSIHIAVPFTVSEMYFGSAEDALDVNACAAIAVENRALQVDGFYYQTSGGSSPAGYCWLISFSERYQSPSQAAENEGLPFTVDVVGGERLVKRDPAETGTVEWFMRGSLAYIAVADPNGSATVGCLEEFDTRNSNGTCDCGAGRTRVEGSLSECRFIASTLSGRKAKRAVEFGGVQW